MQHYLKNAFLVTIFGYSAPKSDVVAIDMLKKAWGSKEKRNLEEIEIIDIKDEEEIYSTWNEFIHTHHYKVLNNFFDSSIARFPRRSCVAEFDRLFNCKFPDGRNGVKSNMKFDEIENYFQNILLDEKSNKKQPTNFWL